MSSQASVPVGPFHERAACWHCNRRERLDAASTRPWHGSGDRAGHVICGTCGRLNEVWPVAPQAGGPAARLLWLDCPPFAMV